VGVIRRRIISSAVFWKHYLMISNLQSSPFRSPYLRAIHALATGPLAFKNDRPPFTEPDRRSQFGRSSFTRHPKLTQDTTVYDEQFGRNRPIQIDRSSLADLPPHGANYFSSVRS